MDRKRSMHFNTSKPPTKWQLARHRAQYYVPILNWLPKYDTKKLGTDTIAALTASSLSFLSQCSCVHDGLTNQAFSLIVDINDRTTSDVLLDEPGPLEPNPRSLRSLYPFPRLLRLRYLSTTIRRTRSSPQFDHGRSDCETRRDGGTRSLRWS